MLKDNELITSKPEKDGCELSFKNNPLKVNCCLILESSLKGGCLPSCESVLTQKGLSQHTASGSGKLSLPSVKRRPVLEKLLSSEMFICVLCSVTQILTWLLKHRVEPGFSRNLSHSYLSYLYHFAKASKISSILNVTGDN